MGTDSEIRRGRHRAHYEPLVGACGAANVNGGVSRAQGRLALPSGLAVLVGSHARACELAKQARPHKLGRVSSKVLSASFMDPERRVSRIQFLCWFAIQHSKQ
jgi:hypothetical protein